ncbi:MAG: DUF3823 domain-containing protein [Chitinophagaceae bacterium]
MKIRSHHIIIILVSAFLFSCKKDNYEEPKSLLSGRVVYKGEAIGLEYNQVPYQLYQFGFGKIGAIGVIKDPDFPNDPNRTLTLTTTFAQDGSYSSLLYDGDYKLTMAASQGPFMWAQTGGKADTVNITMRGSQTLDLEVIPYYMLRTPKIAKGGLGVTASFKAEKIITDATNGKAIERVSLYINKTQFVSGADNIAKTDVAGSAVTDPNNISISVAVPTISPTQNYIFARIGLKVAGVEDMIFTPVTKITL